MSILDLPDSELMLALCIHKGMLPSEADWLARFRTVSRAVEVGPKTVAETETLMAESDRLSEELRAAQEVFIIEPVTTFWPGHFGSPRE